MSGTAIVGWCIVGLITGFCAKTIMPRQRSSDAAVTILLGIAGAFLGGMIARLLHVDASRPDGGAIVAGIFGAIVVLVSYRAILQRRAA